MQTSTELLRNTLRDWCLLSGRKDLTEAEIEVWFKFFANIHPKVLILALQKVTEGMQYMPKPGHLTKAIEEAKAELCWKDKGSLYARAGTDDKGIKCLFWSDEPKTPAYRAVDCPEGRLFLAQLAKTAGKTPDQIAKLWEKWTA